MAAIDAGPCADWITYADVQAVCTPPALVGADPPGPLTEAQRDWALAEATATVWRLTGRRYGECPQAGVPCLTGACGEHHRCRFTDATTIDLDPKGTWPVSSITSVTIAGEVLAPESYLLDGNRWLYRIDGLAWTAPTAEPDDDPLTIVVAWKTGILPPKDLLGATAILACEIMKRAVGDKKCQIPERLTILNRENVSWAVLDPGKVAAEGRTGIPSVDAAITRAWPYGLSTDEPAGMFDPAADPEFVRSAPLTP